MKRRLVLKQVYITEEQERLLRLAARREQRAEAEILRAALDQVLLPKVKRVPSKPDPLWHPGAGPVWGNRRRAQCGSLPLRAEATVSTIFVDAGILCTGDWGKSTHALARATLADFERTGHDEPTRRRPHRK